MGNRKWPHEGYHLPDDPLRLRHIDEDEPHVGAVEGSARLGASAALGLYQRISGPAAAS